MESLQLHICFLIQKELFTINTAYLHTDMSQYATFSFYDPVARRTKMSKFNVADVQAITEFLAAVCPAKEIDTVICNSQRSLMFNDLVDKKLNTQFVGEHNKIKFVYQEEKGEVKE